MSGKTSDAALLCEVLADFDDGMKAELFFGIRRLGLSNDATIIAMLTTRQKYRANALEAYFSANVQYGIHYSTWHTDVLVDSMADQDLVASILKHNGMISFVVFLESYRKLDDRRRERVVQTIHVMQYHVSQLKDLALESNEKIRFLVAGHVTRNVYSSFGYIGSSEPNHTVRAVLDIAETMTDQILRTELLMRLLTHTGGVVKPKQGERIGRMLLATDPEVLHVHRDSILMYNRAYTDAQTGRLYTMLKFKR
jgi:hypothetical protein